MCRNASQLERICNSATLARAHEGSQKCGDVVKFAFVWSAWWWLFSLPLGLDMRHATWHLKKKRWNTTKNRKNFLCLTSQADTTQFEEAVSVLQLTAKMTDPSSSSLSLEELHRLLEEKENTIRMAAGNYRRVQECVPGVLMYFQFRNRKEPSGAQPTSWAERSWVYSHCMCLRHVILFSYWLCFDHKLDRRAKHSAPKAREADSGAWRWGRNVETGKMRWVKCNHSYFSYEWIRHVLACSDSTHRTHRLDTRIHTHTYTREHKSP